MEWKLSDFLGRKHKLICRYGLNKERGVAVNWGRFSVQHNVQTEGTERVHFIAYKTTIMERVLIADSCKMRKVNVLRG